MAGLLDPARLRGLFFAAPWGRPEVTRRLVVDCYWLFLGRAPESEEVIRHHLQARTAEEMAANFTNSREFVERLNAKTSTFCTLTLNHLAGAPPQRIDTEVEAASLRAFLEHIRGVWTALGASEPHWSVVTSDSYRSERIGENLEHFYAHGEQEVEELLAALGRCGIDRGRLGTCLEYGCGVGRVTRWLAARFPKVVGVDISRPHLDLARRRLAEDGRTNADFVHLPGLEELDRLPAFDLLYSKIVLQHNPPPVIALILRSLFARANPGAVLVFQLPTYLQGYRFVAEEYLELIRKKQEMEVHAFPQRRVFELAAAAGLRPLEVTRDGLVGGVDNISTTFVFAKDAPA